MSAFKVRGTLLLLLLVLGVVSPGYAAEPAASARPFEDPEGLVHFDVPVRWRLKGERHGMRFVPVSSAERTVLLVRPRTHDGSLTLESLRATRLSQIRSQDRALVLDRTVTIGGIEWWELRSGPGPNGRGPFMHSLHRLTPAVHVAISLIAYPEHYDGHQADLQTVAGTVVLKE